MKLSVILLALATFPISAIAQDAQPSEEFNGLALGNLAIDAGISIYGYTVTADYAINDYLHLRALGGYGKVKTEVVKEGIQVKGTVFGFDIYTDFPVLSSKVDTEATLGGLGLILDYYPNRPDLWGEGFRVSTGIMAPQYKLEGYGVVNGSVLPHSRNRISVKDIEMEMSIPSISPYLGLGYNQNISENWSVNMDAGVIFGVKYDGYMRGTALEPTTQDEVDYEFNKEMNDKLKQLEPYPMLPYFAFALSYKF